ncbi:hypothetical protein GE21DRAFT_6340 [Neurospora crassa]|uniref:Uncharacterized protein n=1 Tax=Neurospora crassa (strain ATCC 24698 / 74-OR23-1A / CBS 708.71 / DSM 1257 / FGSC 987) TaxID=367110 RepID=Q7SA24_NEUCR|nr:hypothetical protein NCU07339 [Neurospora crassa OR74A]EAA33261.1 hypothetical protein NCU07339 [Neurospora crassa OR74A]KHE88776.1 hypothetical protein GE21DRAFT_6340 [Neurospora crassa]|eukprot:XP_962497.1 hypothetical protein NCU07339 [Neurospora crassa OR74A]
MGSPDLEEHGKTSVLVIAGVIGLGFLVFYINRRLNRQTLKRCWGFLEKRGWIKPAETEEDRLEKQHQTRVALKPQQSAIPAVLKKPERAHKAPDHITANDHPDDSKSSNRDSGASWDPTSVRSHHLVSLAHSEPSVSPNTGVSNSARTSWPSVGSSVSGLNSATAAPQGAAYHGRRSPSRIHDNNHAARRDAMDHGQGTGTGVWLKVLNSGSTSSPPPEAVPKAKEIFPILSVPSQAVSISSFSSNPTPK